MSGLVAYTSRRLGALIENAGLAARSSLLSTPNGNPISGAGRFSAGARSSNRAIKSNCEGAQLTSSRTQLASAEWSAHPSRWSARLSWAVNSAQQTASSTQQQFNSARHVGKSSPRTNRYLAARVCSSAISVSLRRGSPKALLLAQHGELRQRTARIGKEAAFASQLSSRNCVKAACPSNVAAMLYRHEVRVRPAGSLIDSGGRMV